MFSRSIMMHSSTVLMGARHRTRSQFEVKPFQCQSTDVRSSIPSIFLYRSALLGWFAKVDLVTTVPWNHKCNRFLWEVFWLREDLMNNMLEKNIFHIWVSCTLLIELGFLLRNQSLWDNNQYQKTNMIFNIRSSLFQSAFIWLIIVRLRYFRKLSK